MLGSHLIRTYSKTQSTIAKSSGESELYAVVRASAEGLGMATLLSDFGVPDPRVSVGMDASAAIGMAQRTGLNKVRHVEVDVLWIQEQQTRRMLPIEKIPGPQNPSDLCTKNVPVGLLEQYMRQLNVYFAAGRAAVAQQLHAVRRHDAPVFAAPAAGVLLAGVEGCREEPQVIAAPAVGALLAGVIGGLGLERSDDKNEKIEKKKKLKTRSAAERGVDSWMTGGVRGEWKRAHRTPRRALFTPHRVAGGPGRDAIMLTKRITKGTYVGTGEEFVIVDDYADPNCAHRILKNAWIGTTLIHEKVKPEIDEDPADVQKRDE